MLPGVHVCRLQEHASDKLLSFVRNRCRCLAGLHACETLFWQFRYNSGENKLCCQDNSWHREVYTELRKGELGAENVEKVT